jgi:hypothetical protein
MERVGETSENSIRCPQFALASWRTHSCVPRRDCSRRQGANDDPCERMGDADGGLQPARSFSSARAATQAAVLTQTIPESRWKDVADEAEVVWRENRHRTPRVTLAVLAVIRPTEVGIQLPLKLAVYIAQQHFCDHGNKP